MSPPKKQVRLAPSWASALLALALVALSACSVVTMGERRFVREFTRVGLQPQHIAVAGARLHLWVGGQGRPLLLLHGFGAHALWQWNKQVEALAAHHRVIVPDLPGFGASDASRYSLAHQTLAMRTLLDALEIEECDVVGISYGGLVAWQLAANYPDRVRRLVLVDSPGPAYARSDLQSLTARYGLESAADLVVPRDRTDVRRLLDLAYFDPPWVPKFALQDILVRLYRSHAREQRALIEELVDGLERYRQSTPPVHQPTLVLWGANDPLFPIAVGRRLARMVQNAQFVAIAKARHAPNLERPGPFNRAVLEFLARPPGP